MNLDDIKQALTPCFAGNVFTGPDTLFGSDTLKSAFDAALPNGELVIQGALAQTSDAVTITGVGQGPFATMAVTATFTPSGDTDVGVVVTGTSSGSWSFAAAFPTLATSVLAGLVVRTGATLVLATIASDETTAGLVFNGAVNVAGGLGQVAKLVGSVASLTFTGLITLTAGAPAFELKAPVAAPFSLGPLQNLGFTAVLKPASMALETTVTINIAKGEVTLPAAITFTGSGPVDLIVTAPSASGVSVANLLPYSLGGDLQSLLPPPNQFDPTGALTLDSIDFTIDPATPALTGANFALSSSKSWGFDSKISIGGIKLTLHVAASSGKPSLSGTISGIVPIGNQGSVCTLDVNATLPGGVFAGQLDADSQTPNASALVEYFIGDMGLPTINLTTLTFSAAPTTSTYSLSAAFTSDWTLQIGDHGLSITGASVDLAKAADGVTGSVQGTLALDRDNTFDAVYTLPGNFSISAQIPSIQLSKVVAALCKPLPVSPPGFDFTLQNSTVLLQKTGSDFEFLLGTQLEQYGSAAFVVQDTSGSWGYALGLDLSVGKLAQVPALSALGLIDQAFGLDEILLIVGTTTATDFTFPALSAFNNPNIKSKNISSSGWNGGLVAGLNFYALMEPANSKALGYLCKLVGFSGTFATTIQVPTDPSTSVLTVSLNGSVNSNMPLSGALVAKLNAGNITLGLQGTIPTTIAKQPVTFKIEVDFEANGVFISGSTTDSITFEVVSLGGLAIELGVDDEGIPSIGVAGSIKVQEFDSSIALFFNSQNPAQSLFAGSISDVSLIAVMVPIVGVTQGLLPKPVQDLLKLFMLKGTAQFTIDGSLATALEDRDATLLIKAFGQAEPPVTLNPDPRNISILSGGSSTSWSLTDLAAMAHYHLAKSGNTITVTKEAQVKFVPQTTQIGNLPPVPMGYAMSGELDVYGITGIVDIDIEPRTGLSVEASLSPVQLLGGKLLTITDDNDSSKGPFLSLCSYTKNGKPPHANASGKVNLLGLVGASVNIDISPSGAAFELSSNAVVFNYDIKGAITAPTRMNAEGSANVGLDRTLDLGALGSVAVNATVGGTVKVALNGSDATAKFAGSFKFQSQSFTVGPLQLNIDGASLANLAATVATAAADAIKNWLMANLDPTRWLNWVKGNIIPSVAQNAQQVGQVLGGVYKQSADAIAGETRNVLNYGPDAAAVALNAAHVGADDAINAMAKAGYAAQDAINAVEKFFKGVHIDVGLLHVDTPAGPHGDFKTPPHVDGSTHGDIPSSPHADTGGNHIDSHTDAWGHGFHGDTHAPHIDTGTPHVDTHPHADTPAGPHTDSPVPPHVDTGHVDVRT